ncbi:hypothetical protein KAI11_02490, partial [Candidatus Bathyarchaeota archaeon]|nr:hypothetical protein [Candidatus Bathyarchaeota archaeon]
LIDEILTEIDARQKLVDKLQKDTETYDKIAELKSSEVEAISQLLRGEIRKDGRRSFLQNIIINFTFFCAGIVVTYFIGLSIAV